jgi:AAA15 family ATPase/GTPase
MEHATENKKESNNFHGIIIKNYRNICHLELPIQEGITFILGLNNIGKSNLIKLFYELRGIFINMKMKPYIDKDIRNYTIPTEINGAYFGEIRTRGLSDNEKIMLTCQRSVDKKNVKYIFQISPSNIDTSDSNIHVKISPEDTNYSSLPKNFGEVMDEIGSMISDVFLESMYVGSFRTTNSSFKGDYFDIENGQNFIETWDNWASGNDASKRDKILALKAELQALFGLKNFALTVSKEKDNLLVDTGEGSFNLDELGGGIGQITLILANALFKNPSFILIDEPEIGLHPKLQIAFMQALAAKAKHGVIATSHSIGLARSCANHIYSLKKNKKDKTKDEENKKDDSNLKIEPFGGVNIANAIQELGYSQFVEIGGNNILMVEGPTDVPSFRELLRKYGIDQNFIIMSLGGKSQINMNHIGTIEEIKRLNANSYSMIIDSDRKGEDVPIAENIQKYADKCRELGFNVHLTERHSTENYITQNGLDKVFKKGRYKQLETHYDNFEGQKIGNNKWDKNLNWKMFRAMSKEDFHETDLERFIIDTLMPLTKDFE